MEQVLTRGEVADTFGVRPKTIRQWEIAGIITPAYYQRGHPRYKLSDVQAVVTPKQESYYYKKVENKKKPVETGLQYDSSTVNKIS
jgi:predicted site-specific integrase-resolvase